MASPSGIEHNLVTVLSGSFDILHPERLVNRYTFHLRADAPVYLATVFDIPADLDAPVVELEQPVDCAIRLHRTVAEVYWKNSDILLLKRLVRYLTPLAESDFRCSVIVQRELLITRRDTLNRQIATLQQEIDSWE